MDTRINKEQDWEIDHLVVLEKDGRILVAAKQQEASDLLFLIDQHTGEVYVHQPDGSWEKLWGTESRSVIAQMVAARNREVPIYSISN